MFQERSSQAKTWGKKGKERGRETREEKERKGEEKKSKCLKNVVNYPIKQFSLRSKNRNGNLLSQILIAFDGTQNKKTHLHITV